MAARTYDTPPANAFQAFLRMEASAGILLCITAAIALIVANSGLYPFYKYILQDVFLRVGFSDGGAMDMTINKPLRLWINDALMAIFFFFIGLEIKREFVKGELSSRERAVLPFIGAVGGMAMPALIFWHLNNDIPGNLSGWAIPAATDIAFALGVLSLVGSRVPVSLKALLLGIAVLDDLGAVMIIAAFYTDQISVPHLMVSGVLIAVLFFMNRMNVTRPAVYALVGFFLWLMVLKSGVHATLAGVITALFVPTFCRKRPDYSPLQTLEHNLHPWVAFFIMPVFGFANAGVPFEGMGLHSFKDPVTLGIAMGLFFGKQIGVFGFLLAAIKLRLASKPAGASWMQIYGLSCLCGIGFTMSLFIGGLSYDEQSMQAAVRLGVLMGSISSAVLGFVILRLLSRSQENASQ